MTRQERRDLIREIWGEQKGSQLVWVGGLGGLAAQDAQHGWLVLILWLGGVLPALVGRWAGCATGPARCVGWILWAVRAGGQRDQRQA